MNRCTTTTGWRAALRRGREPMNPAMKTAWIRSCVLSLAGLLVLAAGCTVDEKMTWSPDGTRAAVETDGGNLCLADTNGVLSAPVATDVVDAAWLPDGRGLVLLREMAMTNWSEAVRMLPREEVVPVEAVAGALPAVLKSGLAAAGNDYDAFGDRIVEPLQALKLPLEAALLCLHDAHPAMWTDLVSILQSATNQPGTEKELRDAAGAVVREVSVMRLDGGRPSGAPVVIERTLRKLAGPRPSPSAAVVAYTRDDTLTVASLDGGTGRFEVAERVAGSYDWTPDGRALVFAVRFTDEWGTTGLNLAHVQRRGVVGSNGVAAAGASEPLALSAFAFPPRVRCLPDGRVLFAGVPVTLPAAEVAGASRFFVISMAGGTNSGPVAIPGDPAALPIDLAAFAVSPDGRRVAIAESGSDAVAVLELSTGALEVVSPARGAKSRTMPAWRGNSELYFAAISAEGAKRADWMRWTPGGGAPAAFSAGWPAAAVDGLLELPGGIASAAPSGPKRAAGLTTTTPVTQDRDRKTYDWKTRHGEILARHRAVKPDVVILGDSIIHYWGGEPKAPKAWAPQAWSNSFAGLEVTNMGFGWDRTENVLWRIDHGELDGIAPKVVVIKIGTNNTAVNNTPEEIAAGIEAVCAAAHAKQPAAKVLLLGILPRRDEKPPRPSVTDRVNAILLDRLAGVPWLTVCDVGAAFRNPDGTPNAALFADGVHVNAAGYDLLGAAIRETVTAILAAGAPAAR